MTTQTPLQTIYTNLPNRKGLQQIWVKRDDLFELGGAYGGKVRACDAIINAPVDPSATANLFSEVPTEVRGLVTASSRKSPQAQIVARLGQHYKLPTRLHMPAAKGPNTHEMDDIIKRSGELVQHRPGHNTVIIRRAKDDAEERGWLYIPFGMEHPVAIEATATQLENVTDDCNRIVMAVGSGMSLAGVLRGCREWAWDVPIVGVVVGADPTKRLDKYAPGWRRQVTLVDSHCDYHETCTDRVADIELDPIYEAKVVRHLKPGDCFWVVGIRTNASGN